MRNNLQLTIPEQAAILAATAARGVSNWRRRNPQAAKAVTVGGASTALIRAAQNAAKNYNKKRKADSQGGGVKKIQTQRGSGYTYVKGTKRTKKRGKITLKKRIQALEKTKVPKSHYFQYTKEDIKLIVNQNNRKVFWIPASNITDIESVLTSVEYPSSNVNLTSKNTSIAFNTHHKLYMACAGLHSVQIRIVRVRAADNTSKSPIDSIIEESGDRGITVAKGASVAASATQSYYPESAISGESIMQLRLLSDAYDQTSENWSKIGAVEMYKLNPGDATSFTLTRKFVYKPEVYDQEATPFIKSYSSGFLVEVVGELGHDQTSIGKCGYAAGYVDCMLFNKYTATVQNGLGLKKVGTVGGNYTGTYTIVQAGSNNVIQ